MIDLELICSNAVKARSSLAALSQSDIDSALRAGAEELLNNMETILGANALDVKEARDKGMNVGLLDRLTLTPDRIRAMAQGLLDIAELESPVGEIIDSFERPNGLKILKKRVSIGVIGIIYESRPNVTADAFALCFKTGNAVILKGGSDALQSNMSIVEVLKKALSRCGIDPNAVGLIPTGDRAVMSSFMKMDQYVDLLIPRGGAGLIRTVVENSTIPVIETGTGNCHVYVDESADIEMAISIIMNGKTQRVGVCNAVESLVIHKDIRESLLPRLAASLRSKNVEMRADKDILEIVPDLLPATEEDYATEYLDYIISMKTVGSVQEAVEHINRNNTKHSECIVTKNESSAQYFLDNVDAACVYVNASTRFTDGFEFGLGAEIGISTQKLHARGPMGLEALTTYKYLIYGNGQIRG